MMMTPVYMKCLNVLCGDGRAAYYTSLSSGKNARIGLESASDLVWRSVYVHLYIDIKYEKAAPPV
jgi:hypothetical protein